MVLLIEAAFMIGVVYKLPISKIEPGQSAHSQFSFNTIGIWPETKIYDLQRLGNKLAGNLANQK